MFTCASCGSVVSVSDSLTCKPCVEELEHKLQLASIDRDMADDAEWLDHQLTMFAARHGYVELLQAIAMTLQAIADCTPDDRQSREIAGAAEHLRGCAGVRLIR